ncbi:arf-GAP with SH3 domain, ANK repeat and PH domain-containing protein 2-like [Ptychodera flava]|uniref:arf-GAP with SH3 domain, ANK repeat and PH domain-containing protein 2-like n=1 Tax=Ptychodera flava TaxID=63121 RepID=UPI003969BF71
MPDQITVTEFLEETREDLSSPTTSNFVGKMGLCRNTISALEETLDSDRSALGKLKKSLKAVCNSGIEHVSNETLYAENLEKLGTISLTRETEPDIGAAFLKFSVVTKELSAVLKNMTQNFQNIVLFPLDSLLKGDLKGQKGDLKKSFDKACKDYESKYLKIEKEKKQSAKEAGTIRSEISGPEIAEEMEKERRMFQLQTCEYLIKVNEIKAKKGVDLLQHLVEFSHTQHNFFLDGMKTLQHFKSYVEELTSQLQNIKQQQDDERRELTELRNRLRGTLAMEKESQSSNGGYALHQPKGNKTHGSEKDGYLHKRSEGIRKVYQKRRCCIRSGYLFIAHSTSSKPPVMLNLLTCQVKLAPEDGKKCFDLITRNRTYHFMAETEEDMEEWMSVLNNSREEALRNAFDDPNQSNKHLEASKSVRELTHSIVEEIKRMEGNNICCDCNAVDPTWLSTNLGILTCIECSGVHRDMGVHISRIQSLTLDVPGTSQLLLATSIGNSMFNDIMEASLDYSQDPPVKPMVVSSMDQRKSYIKAKYEQHAFAQKMNYNSEDILLDLEQAVVTGNMTLLLQVFASGIDLMSPLPNHVNGSTALHLAIERQDYRNLQLVDFIVQNSSHLERPLKDGTTVLHLCAQLDRTESLKLILKSGVKYNIENNNGETPLDIAINRGHRQCEELLRQAGMGKYGQCENVNVEWGFSEIDGMDDAVEFSDDDELEERHKSPVKRPKRPATMISFPTLETNGHHGNHNVSIRDRSSSAGQGRRDKAATTAGILEENDKPLPAPKPRALMQPPPLPPHGSKRKAPPPPLAGHHRTSSDPPPPSPLPPVPPARGTSAQGYNERDSPPPVPPPKTNSLIEHMKQTLSERPELLPNQGRPPSLPQQPINYQPPTQKSKQSITLPRDFQQATITSNWNSTNHNETANQPVLPTPKPRIQPQKKLKRVQALYDCEADNADELTFEEGDIIIVTNESDPEWWVGEFEKDPDRKGFFPVSFVHILSE